jgi:hypothetical protein
MSATRRVQTLAWFLTALTCFLAGMAVVEARRQPVAPLAGLVVTVEVVYLPTATPEPAPLPSPTSTPHPWAPIEPGMPRLSDDGGFC